MSKDKKLLEEELKRHNSILEYAFNLGEQLIDEDPDEEDEKGDNPFADSDEEDDDSDEKIDTSDDAFGDEDGDEDGDDDFGDDDAFGDDGDDFGDISDEEPAEDEVEIDITQLVADNEATKSIANSANQKMDSLISNFAQLQNSLKKMDTISKKIDDMEVDLDKRMPSEEEKLEMRSLDSYPYSLKLTDYWSEKQGKYDVMGNEENEEMVLTQQDVEDDYNANTVKDSFSDYEESDVPM